MALCELASYNGEHREDFPSPGPGRPSKKEDETPMNVFEKEFQVRSYEVDLYGRVSPRTLLNYLQDAAGEHADRLGLSVTDLFRRDLTWVLSRYHVQFLSYPPVGQRVRVQTWPSGRNGRFAVRDFQVADDNGSPIAKATSSWMVVSLKTGRSVRLEDALPDYPVVALRALEDDFATLPKLDDAEAQIPFRVRMGDLDINRHVNNVIYADWALESVPEDIIRDWCPASLEIAYRASATYGDRITSKIKVMTEGDSPEFLHQLVEEGDGRELTRLRTRWQKRAEEVFSL